LVFNWRVGFEIQANPSSSLSPYLHLSPAYDPVAIADYFRISRELKDAYPADYNDLGKLWDVIKRVASFALPVISGMGPIGAMIGTAGGGLISGVDAIRGAVAARKAKKAASVRDKIEAQVEASRARPSAPNGVKPSDTPAPATVERARKALAIQRRM